MNTSSVNIDLVIPVLDDTPALTALLGRIAGWPMAPSRVIVVAARADDALQALCARHRTCRLLEAPPNRGAQLDLGARASDAKVLWFLHADAAPPAGALEAISASIANGAESGCFRFAFQGQPTLIKRLIEGLVAARIRAGGVAYGDQGLFALRQAYVESGGFAHEPLFEEVPLVRALKRRGTFRPLELSLPVATRRWERDGWLTRSLQNRWLAICFSAGVPATRLARRYERRGTRPARTDP